MNLSSERRSGPAKSDSHAVSRSKELLACANTAWKIYHANLQQPADQPAPTMPQWRLASTEFAPAPLTVLEEGLTLLRAMEFGLKQLQVLVRRRGHTNDPTQEIAALVQQLEQDTKELTAFCQQLLQNRQRHNQAKRHWELVVKWFQQVANHYGEQLQQCLKLRGDVLADQAQQRKKLMADATNGTNNNQTAPSDTSKGVGANGSSRKHGFSAAASATPLFDSPLFTAQTDKPSSNSNAVTPLNRNKTTVGTATTSTTNSNSKKPIAASSSSDASAYYGGGGYGGYGGGYGGGGYGMRQRRGEGVSSSSTYMDYSQQQTQQEEEERVHQQIQERQQKRQTQQRLDEAQQAETRLGELGQLFGQMSNMVSQQGEVLEHIEDDVEAAHSEVLAGQEELTKLHGLKKGNRPLIIQTFLILNFLIIFMSFYKKK